MVKNDQYLNLISIPTSHLWQYMLTTETHCKIKKQASQ